MYRKKCTCTKTQYFFCTCPRNIACMYKKLCTYFNFVLDGTRCHYVHFLVYMWVGFSSWWFFRSDPTKFLEKKDIFVWGGCFRSKIIWFLNHLFGDALTSKLSFGALSTTFFDRLDIFSDATNLKITLVAFVSALPAPGGSPQRSIKNVFFSRKIRWGRTPTWESDSRVTPTYA